jgi:hypothetical protein
MEKLRLSTYEIGPDCKCLRYKCFGIISLLQKKQIIKILNEILTRDEQNLYLSGLIITFPIKNRTPRVDEEIAKFHDKSYSYRVRTVLNDLFVEIQICYSAFFSLHGITARLLQTIQTSLKEVGQAP